MVGSRIEGLGELRATFSRLGNEMKNSAARRIVAKGAGVLKKEARIIAQSKGLRKTGALINNIVVKREKTPDGVVQYNLGVRHGRALGNGKKVVKYLAIGKSGRIVTRRQNDPFYWRFVHFGTRNIKNPTPFISMALDNKQAEAISAMEAQAKKELERAGK